MPVGPASIVFGPGGCHRARTQHRRPGRWKRYRGGTAGHLWIDRSGSGQFERFLADLPGNIASPMWLGTDDASHIFFCQLTTRGRQSLQRARGGRRFSAGTPITSTLRAKPEQRRPAYRLIMPAPISSAFDPATDSTQQVAVDHRTRAQRNRKFRRRWPIRTARFNPTGDALAVTTRGKAYTFFNHEGPVVQLGGAMARATAWPIFLNEDRMSS